MGRIDLYYLSPNVRGGWVTYTAHLVRVLQARGHDVNLRKIGKKTEYDKRRSFGYGLDYQNVTLEHARDAVLNGAPSLIVAAAKNYRDATLQLYAAGAHLTVHDPTELKNLPNLSDGERCVVIRRAGLRALPRATFIRHPYVRQSDRLQHSGRGTHAVSTSRIDFDKHTNIILDANRELDPERRVRIHGFENRLYTRFKICPKYPEWEQSIAAYPREHGAAFKILSDARFAVDMSIIKGDGGGTQYTFLEAWDAGAVVVLHREWLRDGDSMREGVNCLAAEDGSALAHVLRCAHEDHRRELATHAHECLRSHSAEEVGPEYERALGLGEK